MVWIPRMCVVGILLVGCVRAGFDQQGASLLTDAGGDSTPTLGDGPVGDVRVRDLRPDQPRDAPTPDTATSPWTVTGTLAAHDLNAVWGQSATSVFAVGNVGTILRFDGKKWSTMSSNTTSNLSAIGGSGPTQVFAVGAGGYAGKFDGTTWSATSSHTTSTLTGVWGNAATDIVAVDDDGSAHAYFAPGSWDQLGDITATTGLTSIWGSGTKYMAGGYGGMGASRYPMIVLYDGTTPSYLMLASKLGAHINAIWGTGQSECVAVGSGGLVMRYSSSKLTTLPSSTGKDLNGVWCASSTRCVAVGNDGLVLFYDGAKFTATTPGSVTSDLHGVWGSGPKDVWVVGKKGLILRYAP